MALCSDPSGPITIGDLVRHKDGSVGQVEALKPIGDGELIVASVRFDTGAPVALPTGYLQRLPPADAAPDRRDAEIARLRNLLKQCNNHRYNPAAISRLTGQARP